MRARAHTCHAACTRTRTRTRVQESVYGSSCWLCWWEWSHFVQQLTKQTHAPYMLMIARGLAW